MTVKGQRATEAESEAFFIILEALKKLKTETISDYPMGSTTTIMDALREKFNIEFKKER